MSSETGVNQPEITYFGLQAYLGTTKHMGGLAATRELVERCHISSASYVLDVGCGAGATPAFLAQHAGCRVLAVDVRESMVALTKERIGKLGLERLVEARVADALNLDLPDGSFDAAISESVATFVEDRKHLIAELARVTRPGGYVGLNEEVWLEPPSPEMVDFARRVWDISVAVPTADDYLAMMQQAGLQEVSLATHRLDARRDSTQISRYNWSDMFRMMTRTMRLFVRSAEFRRYMIASRRLPRHIFRHLGYVLLVGRK